MPHSRVVGAAGREEGRRKAGRAPAQSRACVQEAVPPCPPCKTGGSLWARVSFAARASPLATHLTQPPLQPLPVVGRHVPGVRHEGFAHAPLHAEKPVAQPACGNGKRSRHLTS
jgi:hypothetical protein